MNEALKQTFAIATADVVPAETPGNLAIADFESIPVDKILRNVSTVQALMGKVMKLGVHFGPIEGCGDKYALKKPGAEKLCMTFRLIPRYEIKKTDLGNGHREIEVITRLEDPLGRVMGMGVGSCSTMESKYRWRKGDPVSTGKSLPRGYWDLKKSTKKDDQMQAVKLLGGRGFVAMKDAVGQWVIGKLPETKVEHPDIADTWNTVLKQGKKRSHVDATISTLAVGDMFEQDVGDDDSDENTIAVTDESKAAASAPKAEPAAQSGYTFTYDLSRFDDKKKANYRIYMTKEKAKEVSPNVWECGERIASLDSYLMGSRATPMCTNCGTVPVDAQNGQDTCNACLEKM